jgi:hypothetical protein
MDTMTAEAMSLVAQEQRETTKRLTLKRDLDTMAPHPPDTSNLHPDGEARPL